MATATKMSPKKWSRPASNFIALIPSRSIRQMLAFFLELSSKILYQSSGKEKESRYLVFTSSTKREIRELSHRSRAVTARKCAKKRDARAKLFFSANITNCFLPFLLTSPSSMLKLPLKIKMIGTLQSVVHRQVQKTNNKEVWRAS